MSGRRQIWVLAAVALLAASCGSDGDAATTSTVPPTTVTTTTTTAPGTTTTTTTIPVTTTTSGSQWPDGLPALFRFGDDGLFLVDEDGAQLLLADPVAWAWADYLGGVVFQYGYALERPGVFRLPAGSADPVGLADLGLPVSTAIVEGRASMVGVAEDLQDGALHAVRVLDLVDDSLRETNGSFGFVGQDGSQRPVTAGGDRLAGVAEVAVGACGTSASIHFWDWEGPTTESGNRFPESCEPCELSVRLSPDGSLLAYRFRPDAKWPFPEMDEVSHEEWWERSKAIPGELVVIDLESGTEVWRAGVDADTLLADFDGRFITVYTAPWSDAPQTSDIFDTADGPAPVLEIDGVVVLDRSPEGWTG